VSQCPHCRGLRKSRASHVKCECGEKPHGKEDCAHLEKGDSKREHGAESNDILSDHDTVDHYACCCTHGGRCSCALKKEHHLDPVPEIDPPLPKSSLLRKPRLNPTHSDPSLTVFVNGHHKPVHKLNHAAHDCGLPYKIPRPHSIHGHSTLAQKSMDHLPLVRSVEDDPHRFQDSITSAQQEVRLVRSEHGSPGPRSMPSFEQLDGMMPPLDLPFPAYNNNFTSSPMDEYPNQPHGIYESYLPTPEDQPPFSAGLSMPPVDWAALGIDNATGNAIYSQPPSYASFDHTLGRPGLTASSSGEPSELDEIITQSVPSPEVPEVIRYPSTSSEQATFESYQLSEPTTSYMDLPQISALASSSSLDTFANDNYFQGATASPAEFEEFRNGAPSDQEAFIRHGFTLQDAQKLAHPGVPTEAMGELSIPATRDIVTDPLWAPSFPDDASSFDGVDEVPESEWESSSSVWPSGSTIQ
jgi:hypothetical protein